MPANISVLMKYYISPSLTHSFLTTAYFPSISFRASLAFCVFLRNRWLMLLLILFQSHHRIVTLVSLIQWQMEAVEDLILGSVSINTFFLYLTFYKMSEKHNGLLKWVFSSLSSHFHFFITEYTSTWCISVIWD